MSASTLSSAGVVETVGCCLVILMGILILVLLSCKASEGSSGMFSSIVGIGMEIL